MCVGVDYMYQYPQGTPHKTTKTTTATTATKTTVVGKYLHIYTVSAPNSLECGWHMLAFSQLNGLPKVKFWRLLGVIAFSKLCLNSLHKCQALKTVWKMTHSLDSGRTGYHKFFEDCSTRSRPPRLWLNLLIGLGSLDFQIWREMKSTRNTKEAKQEKTNNATPRKQIRKADKMVGSLSQER